MTVIYRANDCILIRHHRQLHTYHATDGTQSTLQLKQLLFDNFRRKEKRKQPKKSTDEDESTLRVKVETFLASLKSERLFSWRDATSIDRVKSASCELLNKFYADSSTLETFHGENNLTSGQRCSIGGGDFFVPPRCRFFNKPIGEMEAFLDSSEKKFDFVVMDPPWQNRYIKRVKKRTGKLQGYQTMRDEEIAQIPLSNYLKPTAIVACWCTNSDAHIQSFKNELCTRWNLKLLSTWLWMKIDANGELLSDFDGNKRPYERVFIATSRENCDFNHKLKEDLVIFSQPSAIHSHKPPLIDLFRQFLPANPACLEIFARSLNENFTSIGLEVLKLQNALLFEEIS